MRSWTRVFWLVGLIAATATAATPKEKVVKDESQSSIVITFKDGHQQIFPLDEIARIEFTAPSGSALPAGSAKFLGQWKVGDGVGGTFVITLKPGGQAHRSTGNAEGTWKVVGGEAQVKWDDGWTDVIRKVGGKYQKAAYEPGHSPSESPSNVAEAVYTDTN